MKKSILLFILWAAAVTVLTGIYLALMMNFHANQIATVCWILTLCTVLLTLAMMFPIRIHAKTERVVWLAVISKVLLIMYSVWGALGLVFFLIIRLMA